VLSTTGLVLPANTPFAGTWKVNLEKVGIFGVTAFSVSKRLRDLGLRIALGAQRTEVLHATLGRAFKLLAVAGPLSPSSCHCDSRYLDNCAYLAGQAAVEEFTHSKRITRFVERIWDGALLRADEPHASAC
jgi:hypothetical protein